MQEKRFSTEKSIYVILLIFALAIRLVNIDTPSLSDAEAGWASQALAASRGEEVHFGPQQAYLFFTSMTFALFGPSNMAARLWPVLVGSFMVFLPFFFKRWLGAVPALICALGIAFDPTLVGISRIAGSPIFAIGFGLAAIASYLYNKSLWAGIFTGLALLSGTPIVIGLVSFLIAIGIDRFLLKFSSPIPNIDNQEDPQGFDLSADNKLLVFSSLGTILVVGTMFFRYPGGLAGWASTFTQFAAGLVSVPKIWSSRMVASMVLYQPLGVVFGVTGMIRSWIIKDRLVQMASLLTVVTLAVTLIYPGREVWDISWVLVLLWPVAALELWRHFSKPGDRAVKLGLSILILIPFSMLWLNPVGIDFNYINQTVIHVGWEILVAIAILTTLMTAFFYGINLAIIKSGLIWGLSISLIIYTIAAVLGITIMRPGNPREMLFPFPVAGQADLITTTIGDLSRSQSGRVDSIEIVSMVDDPSLKWLLRDQNDLIYSDSIDPDHLPAVIISKKFRDEFEQIEQYTGQDFIWWQSPGWYYALPADWGRWITYREAPTWVEHIIVWARGDLFPKEDIPLDEIPDISLTESELLED